MLLEFRKGDIVRHLGLLDLQRTMQRALRRSGLPVAYSKGFNPHMVMAFASALSSGIPGDAELLDVSLTGETTEEACLTAMNRVLPPALRASRVRLVDDRFPKVAAALEQAEYRITLFGGAARAIGESIPAFLSQDEIMALRKTKKSEMMVNIRPMIHELTAQYDEGTDTLVMTAHVSLVEAATLKPDLLVNSLAKLAGVEPPEARIHRKCLLGEDESGALRPLMEL